MYKLIRSGKLVYFLAFSMLTIGMVGCRATWDKKYYEFQPTFEDRAIARSIANDPERKKDKFEVNGMTVEVKDGYVHFPAFKVSIPLTDIEICDADVISFSSDIQKALRHRMNKSRRVRLGSGTLQVLAASAGAAIGLTNGDEAVAGGFALLAAIIPELQNIFQARGRVEAYTDGLELIQDAHARYYQNRVNRDKDGKIISASATELTKEGGQLLVELAACIKLVDKALLTHIPTIKDLETATGRIREKFAIKAVPLNVSIPTKGEVTISIINGSVINASSDNANVVTVVKKPTLSDPLNEIKLKGDDNNNGIAKVRLFNNRGGEEMVSVKVGNRLPIANAGKNQTISISNVGKTVTLDGTKSKDPDEDNLFYRWTLTKPPGASIAKWSDSASEMPTFDADVYGTYTVSLVVSDGVDFGTDTATITVNP